MQNIVEEFNRMAGVGPSLAEKAAIDPMFDVLAKAFSVKTVKPVDVRFLRYRKYHRGVELEDTATRFGGILTSVESTQVDPKTLMSFLKKHGAKTFKGESLDESMDVAKTILAQMGGGGKIMAMTGAKQFVTYKDGVSFKFPNRKSSKGNYVKVTLRPDDTYDMTFSRLVKYDAKPVKTYKGVQAADLKRIFQHQTGLRLSL